MIDKQAIIRSLDSPGGFLIIREVEEKILANGLYALDEREILIALWLIWHRNVALTDRLSLVRGFAERDTVGDEESSVDGSGLLLNEGLS